MVTARNQPTEAANPLDELAKALEPGNDRAWMGQANCSGVDPDLFFPERGVTTREAKAVCRACVVREPCLEYALENGEKFGIWGGTSERERRRIRKMRKTAQVTPLEIPRAEPRRKAG